MKKIMALLCAFIIVISTVATVAFAENTGDEITVTESESHVSEEPTTEESTTEESTTEEPTTEEPSTEDITEAPVAVPAEPQLVSLTNTSGGIIFKWNHVDGATSYRVYKRGAGERYWTYLGTVEDTSYTDPRVASGNYYRYTVIAVNDGGYSTFHSGIVIKRLANPYNIKAVNNVDNVTVSWAKINGATA